MISLILLKLFTFSQILQGVPKLLHATVQTMINVWAKIGSNMRNRGCVSQKMVEIITPMVFTIYLGLWCFWETQPSSVCGPETQKTISIWTIGSLWNF